MSIRHSSRISQMQDIFNFSQSFEKTKQKTAKPHSIFLPSEMYMDYIPES